VVGLARDHETLQPVHYFERFVGHLSERTAIIVDPMLATAGSMIATIDLLKARGCRDIRKHAAWYFKGYPVGGDLRGQFAQVTSLAHIDDLIGELDLDAPYPGEAAEGQRGRAGRPKRTVLPDRWLESRTMDAAETRTLADAELDTSGG
jgi:hypothetical protein